jgi:hypothetical protein
MPKIDREVVLKEIEVKQFQIQHETDPVKKAELERELAALKSLLS